MMRWIRQHKESLLISILVIFFLSIFVGFGSYVFTSSDTRGSVAKVGRSKIPLPSFNRYYNQTLESIRGQKPGLELTPEIEGRLKNDVLRDLIVKEMLKQEANRWGFKISPRELSLYISSQQNFQKDGHFSPQIYYQYVTRQLGLLPKDFEKEIADELLNGKIRNALMAFLITTPQEASWVIEENKAALAKSKDQAKETQTLINQHRYNKAFGLLNLMLFQLSQKMPVRTYLDQAGASAN